MSSLESSSIPSASPNSLRRNIPVSYLYSFFGMFLVLVPILVVYQQSIGLTMSEILQIQAVFCAAVAVFEVPTGYVADVLSRKLSVCIGAFVSAVGFSFLPFIHTYNGFVLFELIIAFGSSLKSGADFSILYESLGKSDNRLRVIGNDTMCSLVGEAVASVCCGLLVMLSFQAVLFAQVAVGWIIFLVALFFIEPDTEKMAKKNPFANMRVILKFLLVDDSFVRLIFINAVIWGLSSFCVVWLLQPFWQNSGVPLSWFGFLWAGLMLVAAACSKSVHAAEKKFGVLPLLFILSLSSCSGYLLMYVFPGWVGVVAGVLFYVNRGVASVLLQDALNWRVPASFRSTANSLQSLFFRLSYGFIGPMTGISVDRYGLQITLLFLGLIFAAIFIVVMLPLIHRVEEMKLDYVPVQI